MPSEAAQRWWHSGVAMPRWARAWLITGGAGLMLFAIWVKLMALYPSAQVREVMGAAMFTGWGLLLTAMGLRRGSAGMMLALSADGFLRYYLHGEDSGELRMVSAVTFLALGIILLKRGNEPVAEHAGLTTLHLSDRPQSNHG